LSARRRFLLYSRAGCTLCEEMLAELLTIPGASACPIEIVDIDCDAAARSRYGYKIPVLLFEGELVCHGRLDRDEVFKALAAVR